MIYRLFCWLALAVPFCTVAAPIIDPISDAVIPAGKSLIIPVTAASPNGRPLTFTASSGTNGIAVDVQTNNPFWKMSVVQVAPSNAPGAFQTPFRGGLATVTNVGDMTFMLFPNSAPHTVDVIEGLTASGFYNSNTIFHRVVHGFVIQGGDPLTNGTGGPVFRYDDEFDPRALFSGNGQLAMANSGKDTDGSQFFVTLGPQRFLDFGYTLFGQLVRGFEVLTNINNTPTNSASRPLADVIITRASLVPDPTDTVLTLTGTNLAGVSGTITIIADDGAGGRATNSFIATTVTDTNNAQPFLYPLTVTNLVAPMNGRLTNIIAATDLEGDTNYWFPQLADQASILNASNSTYSVINGQLQLVIVPATNYVGPVNVTVAISPSPYWPLYPLGSIPYDQQYYTFVIGDTPITAFGTNFVAKPSAPFANQLLASFTNGVPGSATDSFSAFINWGDNTTNSGTIVAGAGGWKEVRGSHTYTYGGDYPVYVTLRSSLGVSTTVVTTAIVPPALNLVPSGTNSLIRWPAWATDYRLQSSTSLAGANWTDATNLPGLIGYDIIATNGARVGSQFFRLKR